MKAINIFLLAAAIMPYSSLAKNLEAHVHGSVNLDIATEKTQILVMLKSPAESFIGFEYKAKTNKEINLVKKVKNQWNNGLLKLLGNNAIKNCKITKSSWYQKFDSKNHSTIFAESYIKCNKLVKGKKLKISLKKIYKNIKQIHLQLIREDGTVINKKYTKEIFEISL